MCFFCEFKLATYPWRAQCFHFEHWEQGSRKLWGKGPYFYGPMVIYLYHQCEKWEVIIPQKSSSSVVCQFTFPCDQYNMFYAADACVLANGKLYSLSLVHSMRWTKLSNSKTSGFFIKLEWWTMSILWCKNFFLIDIYVVPQGLSSTELGKLQTCNED